MNFSGILSIYVVLNILVICGFLLLKLFSWASRGVSARTELRLHYLVLALLFVLPFLQQTLPPRPVLEPIARVWSTDSPRDTFVDSQFNRGQGYLTLSEKSHGVFVDQISQPLWVCAILIVLLSLLKMVIDILSLRKIRRSAFTLKNVGHVTLFASDAIKIPFSYWLPGTFAVVVPSHFLTSRDYRSVVAHELQHHRQGDTQWVFAVWVLRTLCFANPVIHLWSRWLSDIQEFACDEALVDQHKVESRQYARCLVETAENASRPKGNPICAMGLSFRADRTTLKRRIQRMLNTRKKPFHRAWGILLVAGMAGAAFASRGLVQDRRLSLADAERLAASSPSESDFPIQVNDLVLKELNRFIGTPEGREQMRNALRRFEDHRAIVEGKLKQYEVPFEIAAVPIIESRYQNLEPNNQAGWGAGLWMFIASTARTYGLRVDADVDERLNIPLETDAAMRYLKSDRIRYGSWLLSLLAYNWGEGRLEEAMRKTGSRDPWVLVRQGFENDKGYLAKVMAAVIILKNPDSVK